MELTKKDKQLLLFLAYFVVFVLFLWGGILPLIDHIDTTLDGIDALTEQKMVMENDIASISTSEVQLPMLKDELGNKVDAYYGLLESQQVEKLITEIILKYNLLPEVAIIEMPESTMGIANYHQIVNKDEASKATMFYAPQITVKVSGSEGELQTFLDDIANNYPAIFIKNYTMAQERETITLTAILEVIMCDKAVLN